MNSEKDGKPSVQLGIRVPSDLWGEIEAWGVKTFPSPKGWDKTATIINLIRLGLGQPLNIARQPIAPVVSEEIEARLAQLQEMQEVIATLATRLDALESRGRRGTVIDSSISSPYSAMDETLPHPSETVPEGGDERLGELMTA